jgi:hypothetical protein
MNEDTIAKNLEPLLTAAVIPALWKLGKDKNVRPVVIKIPRGGQHFVPLIGSKIPEIPRGKNKGDGIWWQENGWQVYWVEVSTGKA